MVVPAPFPLSIIELSSSFISNVRPRSASQTQERFLSSKAACLPSRCGGGRWDSDPYTVVLRLHPHQSLSPSLPLSIVNTDCTFHLLVMGAQCSAAAEQTVQPAVRYAVSISGFRPLHFAPFLALF